MICKVTELITVILAAGKGTRMKSDLPKVLHQIQGKTLIHHVIRSALELQPNHNRIIVVVGHQKEKVIQSVLDDFPSAPIEFVTQDPQLGTAHAVLQASPLIAGHLGESEISSPSSLVLVLSGDVPLIQSSTLQRMLVSHREEYRATVGYAKVSKDPHGLGRIIRDPETQNLQKIIEEKDIPEDQPEVKAIQEINTGIYLFQAQALLELLPQVKNQNKQQEYYLPDVIKLLTQENQPVNLTPIPEQEAQGINTPQQLQEAEQAYLRTLPP